MTILIAVTMWVALAAIAALHAAWGLGSHWPCESEQALVRAAGGTPGATKMYPSSACFVVAALLAGVSIWPLFAVGLLNEAWPRWLTILAGAAIAAVFIARGVAGYGRPWRTQHSAEPFATLDRRYYSPLCLALGSGFLFLLYQRGWQ